MSSIIKFKSSIKQKGHEPSEISFAAPVQISTWEEFDVYEFEEPSKKIMNRIEVSEEKVNIFAGPSAINLILSETVGVEYETPAGRLILSTFLISLKKTKNLIDFRYRLKNTDLVIGEYHIKLEIKNEK